MTGEEQTKLAAIIRRLSKPLEPQPTGVEPRLPKLEGIKAVVFDVYGTLIISGSGDISLTSGVVQPKCAIDSLVAASGNHRESTEVSKLEDESVVAALHDAILASHVGTRDRLGVTYPEVEIRDMWRNVVDDFGVSFDAAAVEQLAIEYECRVNPVWPMPGCGESLAAVRDAGLALGIVSNAQFFTPMAMEELLGDSLSGLGFDEPLCVWSYAHLQAKPGRFLYEQSVAGLAERGIAPNEVLYIGNDMRNDVWPASRVGFRTALFAGDARSLRLREDDPRVAGVEPDAVITDLRQILTILALADG